MNVQLRNSNGYPGHVPIMLPHSPHRWRFGIGDTPGYTPAQQAMADAFRTQYGGAPAVFVQPAVIPTPACASDTQPGGSAFSDVCQQLIQAAEQANITARTNANYNVDLQNCLSQFPQPTDCYQRTFGLTLPGTTGGATGDLANAPQLLGDPAAQALAAEAAHTPAIPPNPIPPTTPQTKTPAQQVADNLTKKADGSTSTPPATSRDIAPRRDGFPSSIRRTLPICAVSWRR